MAEVALTEIRHGKEDGTVLVVKQGDPVKGLPKEVVEQLKADGVVGEPAPTAAEADEEKAALEARVRELEEQLDEAKKSSTPPPAPPAGDKK